MLAMRRESDNNNISGNSNNYPSNLIPNESSLPHLNYHPHHALSAYGAAGPANYGPYQGTSEYFFNFDFF